MTVLYPNEMVYWGGTLKQVVLKIYQTSRVIRATIKFWWFDEASTFTLTTGYMGIVTVWGLTI